MRFVPLTQWYLASDDASYTMMKSTPRSGMISGRIGFVSPARLPSSCANIISFIQIHTKIRPGLTRSSSSTPRISSL